MEEKGRNNVKSSLKAPLLKVLSKAYPPNATVELKFGRYDLALHTNDEGKAILLFMGVKDANGKIKGERYARRLKTDADGKTIKHHWDHKGKATAQI